MPRRLRTVHLLALDQALGHGPPHQLELRPDQRVVSATAVHYGDNRFEEWRVLIEEDA